MEFLVPSFPLLLLSFSLCCDGDTTWWRRDKSRLCSCVLQKGLQLWCDNTIFPLCGLVVPRWHSSRFCFIGQCQSRCQRGSAGCVVNLAPELCGPASTEKSRWLTLHPIRAFSNVERSDSLRSSSGTNYTRSKWKLPDLLRCTYSPLHYLQL